MATLTRFASMALVILAMAGPVLAGQPPSPAQEGFVPIDQIAPQETIPAAPLVIAAYAFAWVAVAGYVWSVWRRLNRVERELADVGRRIQPGGRP